MELDTNAALVRFLEDEGLSPFTLLKLTPKPTATGKKRPASVVMEWGLQDLDHDGDRERFLAWRVTVEEPEIFRSEGALDPFEECDIHTIGDEEAAGIDLRLEAGGSLFLRCRRLVVSDEPTARLRKGRPRPHHGVIDLELDTQDLTWGQVRAWLAIPQALVCLQHRTNVVIEADVAVRAATNVKIVDDAGNDLVWLSVPSRLCISRGKWASDDLWSTIWSRVTAVPGVTQISSRTLVCPPGAWPARPPPKPKPQVWPDVYGVTCDFATLTFAELRALLGLPATCTFVLDGVDAAQPPATLTLGAAPRVNRDRRLSGVFLDEDARPLVNVNASFHEDTLSLQRARGCDDATWRAVWNAPEKLPGVRERHSRTTRSPPDPWPLDPPTK